MRQLDPTPKIKQVFEASSELQKPVYAAAALHKLCMMFQIPPLELFNRVSALAVGPDESFKRTHLYKVLYNIITMEPEIINDIPQAHNTRRFGYVNGRNGEPHKEEKTELFKPLDDRALEAA